MKKTLRFIAVIILCTVILQSLSGCSSEIGSSTDNYDENTPLFLCRKYDEIIYYVYNCKGIVLKKHENIRLNLEEILKYSEDNLTVGYDKTTRLYGFVDDDGVFIIDAQYESARPFSPNGLAPVCKDGKWGFINSKNEVIIDFQFSDAGIFNENGYAFVELEGLPDPNYEWRTIDQFNVINSKGNCILKNNYQRIMITDDYILAELVPESKDDYLLPIGNPSFNVLLDFNGNILDTLEDGYYSYENGKILKYVMNREDYKEELYWYKNNSFVNYTSYNYNGSFADKDFINYQDFEKNILIEQIKVSTTQSGYGLRVTIDDTKIEEVKYEHFLVHGNYLLLYRLDGSTILTDIFDIESKTFTATDLQNVSLFNQLDTSLSPDCFFITEINSGNETLYGIIDQNGNTIIPAEFRSITPYNFKILYNQ